MTKISMLFSARFLFFNRHKYLSIFIIFFFLFALSTKFGILSWNDASRMATIQSIVEQKSFSIDNSVFFKTGDKYFYNNHYYSDKPPILALCAAPVYFALKTLGITFTSQPRVAYYLITIFTIGLISALGLTVFRKTLSEFTNVNDDWADLTTLVTGTGTLILVYSSVFNNHIASGTLLFFSFYFFLKFGEYGKVEYAIYSGLMCSLAGGIDMTCFLFIPFVLLLFLKRSLKASLAFIIACLPIIVLYFLLNLLTSGSVLPPPLNASLWDYPGSYFNQSNLSGLAMHEDFSNLVIYAFHMILGNRGLISHSPVLIFSPLGLLYLYKSKFFGYKIEYTTLLLASLLYIGIYVARTVNYSGFSYGIRWFASLMLIFCFPIAFIESWVRSLKVKYRIFLVVTCFSTIIAIIGSYNPFTPGPDILSEQAHLVQNTMVTGINLLVTTSSSLDQIRILVVSFAIFVLYFMTLSKLHLTYQIEANS